MNLKKIIIALLLVSLTTSMWGCAAANIVAILPQVVSFILGNLTAASEIPPRLRPRVQEYVEPWDDPGFNEPGDKAINHNDDTAGSHTGTPGYWQPPEGASPMDGSGSTYYSQIEPDGGVTVEKRKDSFSAFGN